MALMRAAHTQRWPNATVRAYGTEDACARCGGKDRRFRSLELDCWRPCQAAALLLGGNGRLREHLERRGASDPAVSEPYEAEYGELLALAACRATRALPEPTWKEAEEPARRARRDAADRLVRRAVDDAGRGVPPRRASGGVGEARAPSQRRRPRARASAGRTSRRRRARRWA